MKRFPGLSTQEFKTHQKKEALPKGRESSIHSFPGGHQRRDDLASTAREPLSRSHEDRWHKRQKASYTSCWYALGPWTSLLPLCAGNRVLSFPLGLKENLSPCFNFPIICPYGPVHHHEGLTPETSNSRTQSIKLKYVASLLQAT